MTCRRSARGAGLGLLGWLLAGVIGPVGLPSVAFAAAAATTPDLTVVAATRYDVQPTHRRIHVTVVLHATNHRTDTVIRRYFVDHAVLALLPGTTGFAVSAIGSKAKPTVGVTSRTAARVLVSVAFGKKLGSGATLGLQLTFDMVDRGGAPDRAVRVSSAVAAFPVWAVGTPDTPGGAVSVTAPADYRIDVLGGPLNGPTDGPGGTKAYASGTLSAPKAFGAYILADRPGAYREITVKVDVAGSPYAVVVRSWQDDAAFGTRVAAILRKALPPLGSLIGIPVTAGGAGGSPLAVEEAVTRSAGGYAALFDSGAGRIEVAYDASPAIVLHEAAHAWFNGRLVADRWVAEGFAAYYASQVAGPLKIAITPLSITKAMLAKRLPLNAWASDGAPDPQVDAYAMAASSTLAGLIAGRVGPTGLTAVWKAIQGGEMADQPAHGTGPPDVDPGGSSAPDWRGLLDLIETRTGTDLSVLWRTWVLRPDEIALLDRRATVRAAYRSLVAQAGEWEVPKAIRVALDHWQFDVAADLIARAQAVLAGRPALESAASALGVTLPAALRTLFEGDAGPATAAAELATERAAIDRMAADFAARPTALSPVERVGLMGSDPEQFVADARAAFAKGSLGDAVTSADAAADAWTGALDAGRGRLALIAGILTVFAFLVLLVTAGRDRHVRARWSYRAGQVIRTVGPAPLSRIAPRSGSAPWTGPGPSAGPAAGRSGGGSPGGVAPSERYGSHVSAARTPMAHPLDAEPRGPASRRGAYGTLAADLPDDRSPAPAPPGPATSSGPPDAGARPGDVPPGNVPRDPAPGDR